MRCERYGVEAQLQVKPIGQPSHRLGEGAGRRGDEGVGRGGEEGEDESGSLGREKRTREQVAPQRCSNEGRGQRAVADGFLAF